ncbi:MAG TPA: glycosyltransferase family 1 protein [Vicinamibacterales bacterium]|nr:glycosyltransferase family 1 protein [Vicinamibacterales bacterium]
MTPLRVALCDDFAEERWPSMERVASMLDAELAAHHGAQVAARRVRPPFVRAATRIPLFGAAATAAKGDRFLNRIWRYSRHVAALRDRFDLFHVVDHSYAHLVNALPASRTIVTCHDLDAFRSLLDPQAEPRSAPFRTVTRRIAAGLGRAAHIICDTDAIRRDLIAAGLAAETRLSVIPLGVDGRFFDGDRPVESPSVDLLHVGSTVARKRIDVLLKIVAAVAPSVPTLRLVRVGDPLTDDQRRLARDLGIADRVVERQAVDEDALAASYRGAAIVLQPSDREGFGLPLVEALAAGTPVVASDLPVLREVGGEVVTFCPAGDADAWACRVAELLRERTTCPARWRARQEAGRSWARRFSWRRFADDVVKVYARVAEGRA